MDTFASFFVSQSASGNRWSYNSPKNFRQISPLVQIHLILEYRGNDSSTSEIEIEAMGTMDKQSAVEFINQMFPIDGGRIGGPNLAGRNMRIWLDNGTLPLVNGMDTLLTKANRTDSLTIHVRLTQVKTSLISRTEIEWYPGKSLTQKILKKKPKKGSKNAKPSTKTEHVKASSTSLVHPKYQRRMKMLLKNFKI